MIVDTKYFKLAREIAHRHGFMLDEVFGKDRNPSIVAIRREIACALRDAGASFPEAGHVCKRDHTSMMNLVKAKNQKPKVRLRVA